MAAGTDMDRILDMFAALGLTDSDEMYVLTIPGAPWSKSRPKFTRKGFAYAPKEDVLAEKRTKTFMRAHVRKPFLGNVGIACLFFRPNRQRIDTDNLIKHVCDSATGVLWIDDSQCTAVMGVLELDPALPRTVIAVGQHVSTLCRGDDATVPCIVCGGPIYLDRCRGKPPKTCSSQCRLKLPGAAGSLGELVPCAYCERPFKRINHAQKLCSQQCRVEQLRDQRKSNAKPRSRCSTCDKELAHCRGGRCRDCWRADPSTRLPDTLF